MRVGLDLMYLIPGETGGRETYARELIPAMLESAPELEVVAFVNRDAGRRLADEIDGAIQSVVLPVSARSRAQWAFGELAVVALAARRARIELLHSMANFAPPWGNFRRVVTIHDMQYLAVRDLTSWRLRAATSVLMRLAAEGATRIIAVSAAGAWEIASGLRVPHSRIDIVPNGVRPPVMSPPTSGLRARLRLDTRPVALTVATNLPHKNVPVLLEALVLIPRERRPLLVVAGHGTDNESVKAEVDALGAGKDVRLLGWQPPEQLESLYAISSCFVLPSLHEGFGLPVLEAMARSLPVACSDIPALHEVAGDAALYFNPRSAATIAARVGELLTDDALSARLRQLGLARAARFSWHNAARGTLRSYRRALLHRPSRWHPSAPG